VRVVLDRATDCARSRCCVQRGVPDAAWRVLLGEAVSGCRCATALDGTRPARASGCARSPGGGAGQRRISTCRARPRWRVGKRVWLHALDVLVALRRSWPEEPWTVSSRSCACLPLLEATGAARHPGAFRLANLAPFFRALAASFESG